MQFCQLAADCGCACPKRGGEIGKRRGNARPALEENKCRRNICECGNTLLPRNLPGRQKALEEETVCWQSCNRQCGEHRGRTGKRCHRVPALAGGSDKLVTRVRN